MESSFMSFKNRPRSIQITAKLEKRLCLPQAALCVWWADGLMLMKRARAWLAMRRFYVWAYIFICMTALMILMPVDLEVLQMIRQDAGGSRMQWVNRVALALSYWGDFMGFNMLVFLGLGLTARLRKSLFFRRLVVAAVIGTVSCGMIANVSRLLTGRSRPSDKGEYGFHGPSFAARRQSFPSAHTATAFGASIPVAVALPPVGVPMLIVSAGVSWSRMQNNRHHPCDVLASIAMAIFFGVPLGVVVRRMRRAELQSRRIKTTTSAQLDLAPLNP
jgi:membrane-associated phospholipid phosphatase